MDFQWVAIALGDVAWISLAFVLGFGSRLIGLPPLVGFLATGFVLNYLGITSGEMLQKLADLGITLLLFAVGLKLNLKMLLRPQVWAVTSIHIGLVIAIFGMGIFSLALVGLPLFTGLDFKMALMLAFALSFSSTVFVVKALEEKGEMKALHGRIAIGILVMQDLAAVVFLAASTGELPSPWALLLFLLIPMRPLFHLLLQRTGHGELLILYGLVLALGGAELFELGGVKDDLGALIMGLLISTHPKAAEMSKTMLGFKDLFLVGFFLSIGMTGQLSLEALMIGLLLVPFVLFKSVLFYALMTRFKLRARTSLLATLNLSNYSEFGLIVAAIGVSNGWIDAEWLVVIAIALSLSFVIAARLSSRDDTIYSSYRLFWLKFQRKERLPDDQQLDTLNAKIAIFGMGRVGTGAYDKMRELYGDTVVGVDFDTERVRRHQEARRNVMRGDPSDADFWDNIHKDHGIELVMLALPNLEANIDALAQLRETAFEGRVAAIARYPDEDLLLSEAGATCVFNIYAEAGAGFAGHIQENLQKKGYCPLPEHD
ncbi:potassium transporter Kef [Solemya velum gill symbiont]|uniref:Sodium/proton antiporter KefB1 n=1 Tax=Solemya velum gill symbiont TaxID=2340 RepID=A0A0B0H6I6_SOVGS|nr:cation:proton antiporter family protein [Solemya velum gill symbiont]KHF24267.1 sodium/proton antiporter KefB1 [Solemya velum gill symbiont]OOZ12717.1 potassium transporter Kef [Solemya velum gill symbiont]OOZ17054.1 potassium transporter Kef [Solemya velum gill symbiont]OOZ17556.1 potassium transporter Kef [Solemya velum gill symbiont]OOZ20765.1 potassium transporter Kef [Solemya velum gill symbiont]